MLPHTFYQRENVVEVARDLIGKRLVTCMDGRITNGVIVETEAYCGATDRACHAYNNRRTGRTSVMYQPGGLAYVYLCYGIHSLFNIVTNGEGRADAVLIRAIHPEKGLDIMRERRNVQDDRSLTSGPGKLTVALGIEQAHYGEDLAGEKICLEGGKPIPPEEIIATTRIGVDYAGEDRLLPWRFYWKGDPFVSQK